MEYGDICRKSAVLTGRKRKDETALRIVDKEDIIKAVKRNQSAKRPYFLITFSEKGDKCISMPVAAQRYLSLAI